MLLQGQTLTRPMWNELAKQFGFDTQLGLSFANADTAWSDFEDDFQAIQKLKKIEFMFRWCDKNGDGFVDRAELLEYARLQDPQVGANVF